KGCDGRIDRHCSTVSAPRGLLNDRFLLRSRNDWPCHGQTGRAINLSSKWEGRMVGTQTNSRNSRVNRRRVLKAGTAAAVMAMAPAVLRAQGRAIKIGLVTPTTGPLAIFA